jgi:hypothetical protein
MTHRPKLARPVMGAAACFERYQATRVADEEGEQLAARQPTAKHCASGRIRAVRVKNVLGYIQTDCGNFRHGRLPQVVFNTSTLAHRCRRGASTPSPKTTLKAADQKCRNLALSIYG